MKERIISGAALTVLLVAVVVFNNSFPIALNISIALVSALAVYELIKALDLHKNMVLMLPSVVTAAAVPFTFDQNLVFVIYCVYTAMLFSAMLRYYKTMTFKEVAIVYSMAILIPLGLRTLVAIRNIGNLHGMFYVFIAILAAWFADVGAYFAGTFFGKHKLCPNISPKKTVEGAIGGAIVNMLLIMGCGLLFSKLANADGAMNYLVLAGIGLLGTGTSILGDLSFSLIKRSCQIKDFGQVIPGHGGILDRFDSVIFTAPFVYILVLYFPIVMA
jgi:CDP-diglyceride synthetase